MSELDQDEPVSVIETDTEIAAGAIVAALESAGIRARMVGEFTTAALEFAALGVQSTTTAAASAIDGHALAAAMTSTSSAA